MRDQADNAERGTRNAETAAEDQSAPSPNSEFRAPSSALRSAFGFDRTDEQWLALVRDATTPAGLGTLGPYTLLAEIGRGSQGAVFKAIQPGTQRIIAIKRLAAGAFASASARARFDREVETASALAHPGIVTVLGADTIDGQPILLMEWVDGQPIDGWATAEGGSPITAPSSNPQSAIHNPQSPRPLPDRLNLFTQVCDAVSHAHQRGVLHRDLKPSNILVDRDGRPRILDFGLAKLIGAEDPRRISRTSSAGGIIGTPAYAAPEQLDSKSGGVDTRTDVYALGVILYQILTGKLPFEESADLPSLIQAVRHTQPRRPSQVGTRLGSELDAVVLTALAKEPSRRYQSADALAADVRRFLSGQVVLAHPPSAAYQLRKLISRHRMAFSILAGAAIAVSALAITSSFLAAQLASRGRALTTALSEAQQATARADQEAKAALTAKQQAQTEAARNAASVDFLQGLLDSMGRAIAAGEARPARTMLLDAKAKLESGHMAVQPELEVTLWRRLASTAFNLNLIIETGEFTARATQLCEQNLPADHVELGYCRLFQGLMAENRGDMAKAESLYREASRIFTLRLGEESSENALAINNIGCALKDLRRFDDSRALHERSLAIRTKLFGPAHRDVAMSLRNLGTLARAEKKWDLAADFYKQALDAAATAPAMDPVVMSIRTNMCKLANEQGHLDEAERLTREDLTATVQVYGEDSAAPIGLHQLLAGILAQQHRWDEALASDEQALNLAQRHMPADHPMLARCRWNLAQHLYDAGRYEPAEPALRAAIDAYTNSDPPSPPYVRRSLRTLANCLDKLGRPDEASTIRAQLRQPPGP
jgi:serine/threonine protein kinase/tetratricopeptide (TPR) repeat protein